MVPDMHRPRYLVILFAGGLGLLAGCTSPSSPDAIMDRIDAHRSEYENWPFEIKDAVLSGQVMRGMDTTMVFVVRGSPAERIDRGNGDEVWVYRVRGESSSGGGGGSLLPRGTSITLGGGYPGGGYPGGGYPGGGYPGGGYPGGSYPGGGYPGGSGISLPPIVLGGGGTASEPDNEEEIVFHNGRVSHGDGVK
jgi:hypothetical protein